MTNLIDEVKKYIKQKCKGIFAENKGQFERYFKDAIELEESQQRFELVFESYELDRNSKILDIGCGFGTFVLACRKNGYEAYGLDINSYEIDFAKRRMKNELPAYAGDAYLLASGKLLPFQNESFSVITFWDVLEHIPDYRKVLDEADRVLKPGGMIFSSTPNYLTFRKEPHYHVLWLPLMPKRIGKLYLRLRGRDPEHLLNNIFYITNTGLLRYLKRLRYELFIPKLKKLQNPGLCGSSSRAKVLRLANRLKAGSLIKFALILSLYNPFKRTIRAYAKKRELDK